ncbi:MAG TPA: iron-containing alcohol dehydrogenase [Anaerolineae bacterium]
MMSVCTYIWPGQTHFGFGAVERLGREALALQATAVFIVTDPGVVGANLLSPVMASLATVGLRHVIYDKVPGNPDVDSVDMAAMAYRESDANLIVAVGGGSVLDTAKAVRLLLGGPAEASIAEYALMLRDKARPAPAVCDMPPMIAIPTTAGTGSEVTPWAVITDEARRLKMGVGGAYLMPTVALIDPELTLTLPPRLTAATGMDALAHCVEAYVSTNEGPVALDPMILQGIELIGRSLRLAVARPAHRDARRDMMLAAMIGGIAISSRWLGACHSLAHQLSTVANVHHGVACALMLPHQMAFSLPGALKRYARIAQALDPSYTTPESTRQQAERAVEAVRHLMVDIGLPLRLRDVGVSAEMLPELGQNACLDLNWKTNPRAVSPADLQQLYEAAF